MKLFNDALEVILTRVKMSENKFNSKGTKSHQYWTAVVRNYSDAIYIVTRELC